MKYIFWLTLLCTSTIFSQTKFSSTKYDYSFIFPDGWRVKDKIYNPDVDAKIVDDKGNSFIVTVKTMPSVSKLTVKQEMERVSTQELEEQFNAVYGNAQIVKRGSFQIDSKEFYYFHLLTPFQNGLQLYHKQFVYCYGDKVLSIDACSIETYLDETTPAFAIMLDTFKILNLKNK